MPDRSNSIQDITRTEVDESVVLATKMRNILATSGSVDQGTLLAELIAAFGGAGSIAKEIHKLYQSQSVSPMVKQKILSLIIGLTISTTGRDMAAQFDATELTDEELQIQMQKYTERISAKRAEDVSVRAGDPEGDAGRSSQGEPERASVSGGP